MFDFTVILYYAIPILLLALFGVALYRYLSARRQNKMVPGWFSDDEIKKRKITLMLLTVLALIPAIIVLGFYGFLLMALAHM